MAPRMPAPEHVSLQDRKDFEHVIKQRLLNWRDCPGLSWWARCNLKGLQSGRMRKESQNQRRSEDKVKFRVTQLPASKDAREAQAMEHRSF